MGGPGAARSLSVVIAAYDEANVIGRCLRALEVGADRVDLDVVVVANGCTDDTAAVARRVAPHATVIELDRASKVDALNAGDAAAVGFPRAYLDADIETTAASLGRVADVLADGEVHCAAPRLEIDLTHCPWFVRWFARGSSRLPYLGDDLVGNGVYVLSATGRARFGAFPDLTADDLFVRNLFERDERRAVAGATFVSRPPRTLRDLLAVRRRVYRGNAEYTAAGHRSAAEPTLDARRLAGAWVRHPLEITTVVAINLAARAQVRWGRPAGGWERDASSRAPSP